MMKGNTKIPRIVVYATAVLLLVFTLNFVLFLNFNPDFLTKEDIIGPYNTVALPARFLPNKMEFTLHSVLGTALLFLGCLQISSKARRRWPFLHKVAGVIYLVLGTIINIDGVHLGYNAYGKHVSLVAVYTLAITWFYTTIRSMYFLYSGSHKMHGVWNIKGFLLLMVPSFTRVYVVAQLVLIPQVGFDAIFASSAWAAYGTAILIGAWYEREAIFEFANLST